jgi:hypothetical protein
MKLNFRFIKLITAILLFGFLPQSLYSNPPQNKELIIKANKLLKEYPSGTTPANNVVKIVYFHGSDLEPLANWRDRLSRTLNDVSDFYKEEFYKYGVNIKGIPFEKRGEDFVFNVVKGDSVSQNYTINSGQRIQKEIYNKTKGQIDFSKDHVLVINGLCYQKKDGTYVFHSPYGGAGSFTNGMCQVADCELLDSRLLKVTSQRMAFSEMTIAYKECSVAEFNSWYIGGIAHELGHVFGLPHDFGNPKELDQSSISLMGQYGSHHYREYLWGGKISSVFSSAAVLQLISQPIYTQKSKSRNINMSFSMSNLKFDQNGTGIVLKANIKTDKVPYGVVALIRPSSVSEYFNHSFCNLIQGADSLSIELGQFPMGNYNLQLIYLFQDGATRLFNNIVKVDNKGYANIENSFSLPVMGPVDIQKLSEKLERMEKTEEVKTKLEILKGILNPPVPADPKKFDGARLVLSDASWEKASVGWEKVARNYFSCESEFKFFLEFQGKLYSKGLYAHSPSSYVFNLDKKWKRFSAIAGLRDFAHSQGSARFTVIGDGKVLYNSPAIRTNQKYMINVDISGVKILELQANGTEGHNFNSWAVWLDPVIVR